jgi:hypothetical protein
VQLVSVDPFTFADAAGINDAEDTKIASIAAAVTVAMTKVVFNFLFFLCKSLILNNFSEIIPYTKFYRMLRRTIYYIYFLSDFP